MKQIGKHLLLFNETIAYSINFVLSVNFFFQNFLIIPSNITSCSFSHVGIIDISLFCHYGVDILPT